MEKQINDPVLKTKQYLVRALLVAGYDLYFHDGRVISTFDAGIWTLVPAGAELGKFVIASASLNNLLAAAVNDTGIMWCLISSEVDENLPDDPIDHLGEVDLDACNNIRLAYLQGFHNASNFPPLVPEVLEPGALIIRSPV